MANISKAAMGIGRMEQLAAKDSPVHRLHPVVKLITTFVYVVLTISFPSGSISALMPFLFYPVLLMALSGTPVKPLLTRLALALPFSLMGGIASIFFSSQTAFHIGNLAISSGMLSFVSIMLKTLFAVFGVLILIATTPFDRIGGALSMLHMPRIICLQLIMTYRYLSVLLDESVGMYGAYKLRAPDQKGIKMRDMGSFLGQLLLRSFDRAGRIYQAMKCRGFEGMHHDGARVRVTSRDYAYMLLVCGVLILLRFFDLSLFFGNLVR